MKKSLFKFSMLGAVLTASMMATTSAQAICTQSSKIVERVLSYNTVCYIYLRQESALTGTFYYRMRSTSDKVCDLAGDAQTNRTKVTAQGDAPFCPANLGLRNMGNSRYLYLLN